MKRLYIYALLLFVPVVLTAQSGDRNYVSTRIMLNVSETSFIDHIQYYDGLGRPTQSVLKNATQSKADLVTLQEYDTSGREYLRWIPTPFTGNNGNYVVDFTGQAAGKHDGDANPFDETEYENSSLGRISKQTGAGADWRREGFPRGVSTEYFANKGVGDLRVGYYYYNSFNKSINRAGLYGTSRLTCTKMTDEDGHVTYVFEDRQGRTVLIRQINEGVYHDTYYIYDDFNNLICVLPPKASDLTASNGFYSTVKGGTIDKYGYFYRYDERNRCISKKKPGCEPVYMVYDQSDRLILSQDGNQRKSHLWTVNKYDKLGRLLYVSEVDDATSFATLLDNFKNWLVTESFTTGSQAYPMEDTGYSRGFYHLAPTRLLKVNYYDDYRFLQLLPTAAASELSYKGRPGCGTKYDNARGLLTGTRTYRLDRPSEYTTTIYYYDSQGNVVQERSSNHVGGYDRHYYNYTFSGKLLTDYHEHVLPNRTVFMETYVYSYDPVERLIDTRYNLLNRFSYLLSSNRYDELGRLKSKSVNNNRETITYTYNIRNWLTGIKSPGFSQRLYYNEFGLCHNGNISMMEWKSKGESVTHSYGFTYDDLNRLTDAQSGELNETSGMTNNYYRISVLGYDKHGNINGLVRRGRARVFGTSTTLFYDVVDDLRMKYNGNQLVSVSDYSSNKPVYKDAMYFVNGAEESVEYTYDGNGNMISDKNKQIESVEYNELNLPSRILQEKKYGLSVAGRPVNFTREIISNGYDASGRKLETRYETEIGQSLSGSSSLIPGGSVALSLKNKIDYCGNFIYQNDTLSQILTPEGCISIVRNVLTPYYYLRDHQGNVRVVMDQTCSIRQVNHYYPFGGLMDIGTGGEVQRYKFGGKGLERMNGLDLYDFSARLYDPVLCRFTTPDPLCEQYYSVSPYVYCGNNPINRVDPTGMIWDETKEAQKLLKGIDNKIMFLENNITKYEARLNAGGMSDKQINKLESKISEARNRISNLNTSKSDINILGNDENNIYAFSYINGGEHRVRQGENGKVYIETSSDALSIHEITHVRQSLDTGSLQFSSNGELLNAGSIAPASLRFKTMTAMEVEAYKMQYSYDLSFPGRIDGLQGINVHSVGNINNNGLLIYPYINQYSNFLKQQKKY